MAKILGKNFIKFVVVCLLLGIFACDNNKKAPGGGPNPDLSDPTDDVATNVGPVEQLVTTDVLEKTNAIRANVPNYIEDLVGGNNEGLARILYVENGDSLFGDIDFGESIDCDVSGSKDIIGSAVIELFGDRISGTISGDFTIQYDNCEDIILMDTSDGTCAVNVNATGELTNTIGLSFVLGQDFGTQTVEDIVSINSSTFAPLNAVINTVASDQIYNFSYELLSNTTNTNLNGTVEYKLDLYDLIELEDFVASSTSSVVCP